VSRARTITVTLTEPQFHAIAGAVDLRLEVYADEGDHAYSKSQARILERAWRRIHHAWYGREAGSTR
jgi:hypothetical protein